MRLSRAFTSPNVGAQNALPRRILEKHQLGSSAKRINQDLLEEVGFNGSYYSVMRFVQKQQATPLPFRRIESSSGVQAQVDFGTGVPIIDDEDRRRM